jgi:hypothetical protein
MYKKQISKKTKLCYGEVTSHNSLHSFLATDANSNMSSLNHTHIISTISNAECYFLSTLLN